MKLHVGTFSPLMRFLSVILRREKGPKTTGDQTLVLFMDTDTSNGLAYKKNKEKVQTQHCFIGALLFTVRVLHRFEWAIFRFVCCLQM